MKKFLFILVCLVASVSAFAQNSGWAIVDCDFTKQFSFDMVALEDLDRMANLTDGGLLINYQDFGPAGSLCSISIIAQGKKEDGSTFTLFDGTSKSHFEDVIVTYNPSEKELMVKNKFGEIVCAVIYLDESNRRVLYITDTTGFLNQVHKNTQQSKPAKKSTTSRKSKRSRR